MKPFFQLPDEDRATAMLNINSEDVDTVLNLKKALFKCACKLLEWLISIYRC